MNTAGEYAAHQRRMKSYVKWLSTVSWGKTPGQPAREYVLYSAFPAGKGMWVFWTRPVGGGKATEHRASHAEIMKVRYESSQHRASLRHDQYSKPAERTRAARWSLGGYESEVRAELERLGQPWRASSAHHSFVLTQWRLGRSPRFTASALSRGGFARDSMHRRTRATHSKRRKARR